MAYTLADIKLDIVAVSTENTRWLVFAENNIVIINKNFEAVTVNNAEIFSDFHGDDYSSHFINFTNNACRFHAIFLLIKII